jgi:cobalt-zinc-cadmium efflux system protein
MSHQHQNKQENSKNILIAFSLNLFFTFVEIIGGFLTNSTAILSNAIHDFGDCISLGLAWYFQKISTKGSNEIYSYGYKRFSLLGAIINGIILATGSVLILTVAIPRILNPETMKTSGMILFAIIGVLVNGVAVFRLKKGNSINEKVVSLHLLEDVLGWLAVLIGSIVMFFIKLPVLDPIMSIIIALFVLYNAFKNLRQSFHIIFQGIPTELNFGEITKQLEQLNGIEAVHDLHVWSVDGNYNVLTVHIVLSGSLEMDKNTELKKTIRDLLKEIGIQHATIEFETTNEQCIFEKSC